jgi:hypothetical protein
MLYTPSYVTMAVNGVVDAFSVMKRAAGRMPRNTPQMTR